MAALTKEALPMFTQTTFLDSLNATSSLESADGLSPSLLPVGPKIAPLGPALVPASRSVLPDYISEPQIPDICGQPSEGLSASATLQQFLANRLRASLDVNGSLEYSLTWKEWAMPLRAPICALRASARPTSDKDCTGWRTPDHNQRGGSYSDPEKALVRLASGHQINLEDQAVLAGWNTPRATDGSNGGPNQAGGALPADAALVSARVPECQACRMADMLGSGLEKRGERETSHERKTIERSGVIGGMDNTPDARCAGERELRASPETRHQTRLFESARSGAWSDYEIIPCLDGKARRIESGTFPLAHGVSGRVGLLRGYGNAIVPQVAAEFIKATGLV